MPFMSELFYGNIKLGDFTLGKSQMEDLLETQGRTAMGYSNFQETLEDEDFSARTAELLTQHNYEGKLHLVETAVEGQKEKLYQLMIKHNRQQNDFLKTILKPTKEQAEDSQDSDYAGEDVKNKQEDSDFHSDNSARYSDATIMKGTTAKAKLGDIRITYSVKTCRSATILAQQFHNHKRGTTQFRTFNFKNIEAG